MGVISKTDGGNKNPENGKHEGLEGQLQNFAPFRANKEGSQLQSVSVTQKGRDSTLVTGSLNFLKLKFFIFLKNKFFIYIL